MTRTLLVALALLLPGSASASGPGTTAGIYEVFCPTQESFKVKVVSERTSMPTFVWRTRAWVKISIPDNCVWVGPFEGGTA